MSDNTGNYVEYEELIAELFEDGASGVESEDVTLSGKTVDAGGDIYTTTGTPALNDVLYQGGELAVVIGFPAAGQIRVDRTGAESTIVDGPAKLLRSSQLTKRRADSMIKSHMLFVDRATRQFFNCRTGEFVFEGQNTPLLPFPVPIIEITDININDTHTNLTEGVDYVVFNGRQEPQDDRWNSRIKLNVGRGSDSIYTAPYTVGIFNSNALTTIAGSFGFLEPDGSTPEPIKRAMKLLIYRELNQPITTTGTSGSTQAGPLRRKKVDLHEEEFFASASAESNKKSNLSGLHEVDIILAQYKGPILVTGAVPRFRGQNDSYAAHYQTIV